MTDTLDVSKLGKQQAMPDKNRFAAVLVPQGGSFDDVAHSLRADGFDASEDGTGRGTPLVPMAFNGQMSTPQVDDDLSQTLQRKNPQAVAYQCHGSNVGPMGTMRSGNGNETGGVPFCIQERAVSENIANGPGGKGFQEDRAYTLEARHHVQSVATAMAVRRLTPTECERLQGFPDGHTAITYKGKPAADGPRYRAIGNSMAVPVLRWIGQRIEAVNAISPLHPARAQAREA